MKKQYCIYIPLNKELATPVCTWIEADQAELIKAHGYTIAPVLYNVPDIVYNLGLSSIWMFFEDILYFRNPFRKKPEMYNEKM